MKRHTQYQHDHSHEQAQGCACDHAHDHQNDRGHDHEHDHGHQALGLGYRWLLMALIVGGILVLLRPFILEQMFVRINSYAVSSLYHDEARICKKIIAIDKNNIRAWTALGYAYMDSSRVEKAIPAFEKVLALNPEDKGAASYELGRAYYARGEYSKAIECFERVRSAGARAEALLEADILKYRHGPAGFRSLKSMQTLLGDLADSYRHTGSSAHAAQIQKEYVYYKNKHTVILF